MVGSYSSQVRIQRLNIRSGKLTFWIGIFFVALGGAVINDVDKQNTSDIGCENVKIAVNF